MTTTIEQARSLAARALEARGLVLDARIVQAGGGDDFAEVQTARFLLADTDRHRQRLELALRFYADASHWDADLPDGSLAYFDRGELARGALEGRDQLGSHRD